VSISQPLDSSFRVCGICLFAGFLIGMGVGLLGAWLIVRLY
jgi:hypothetical protein